MIGKWIRKSGDGTVVLFVHGFLSDSEGCWRNDNGTYWPDLVRDEPSLSEAGIYTFDYQTGAFSGTYSVGDAVDALYEQLRLDGVFASRLLVMVCHSMGGIIARRMIIRKQLELIGFRVKIGLFLVASPSLGSSYANWLKALSKILGNAQSDILRFAQNNLWLNDLDRDFQDLLTTGNLPIVGRELIEDRFFHLTGLFLKQVVEPFSGARYFGNPFKVPGADHSTIAKPANAKSIQHRLLSDFVHSAKQVPMLRKADESTKREVRELPTAEDGSAEMVLRANIELNQLVATLSATTTEDVLRKLRETIVSALGEFISRRELATTSEAPVEIVRELAAAGHIDANAAEKLEASLMTTSAVLYGRTASEDDTRNALLDAAFGIARISHGSRNVRFKLKRLPTGNYSFVFAIDDEVLFYGDHYFSADAALRGILAVKNCLVQKRDSAIDQLTTRDGRHGFSIFGANKQIFGSSRTCTSRDEMEQLLAEVCRLAPNAPIESGNMLPTS